MIAGRDGLARLTLAVGLLLASAACQVASFGPRVEEFGPAHSGRGVMTDLMLTDRTTFIAELLEVREQGLLLLTDEPAMVFVPWEGVRHASFDDLRETIGHQRGPEPAVVDRLRLVARYPQGLDDAQLRTLLDAYGQAQVREERR